MQDINFSVNGNKLIGKLFTPDNLQTNNPAALFIHGWQSQQDRMFMLAEALQKQGYICLTFDLGGHGSSEGNIDEFSRKDFLDGAIVAYDFLSNVKGVDTKNILVIGSSFGGYLGALLSSVREVSVLVLRVPANYRDEGFEEAFTKSRLTPEHKEWKSELQNYTATKALRAVHDFKGKVLLVESENDELVPTTVIQSYANAVSDKNSLTHIVMKGATHSITRDEPRQREYTNIVLNWLLQKA